MKSRIITSLVAVLSGSVLVACGGGGSSDGVPAAALKQLDQNASVIAPDLSTGSPPGSNFNLAPFTLQLPTGSSGNIDTVSSSRLTGGYTDKPYFYTDSSDGSMVMMDPTRGWTTSGSEHPRTELHENSNWSTAGTNKLNATVTVTQVPDHTTIGQIFQGTGPSKPLCELQFTSGGVVQLLLESTNQGGKSNIYPITNVAVGKQFNYELSLTDKTVTVKVNSTTKTFTMDSSFDGENFYFKAGDYDQSAVSGSPLTTPGTVVKFYALSLTHQ